MVVQRICRAAMAVLVAGITACVPDQAQRSDGRPVVDAAAAAPATAVNSEPLGFSRIVANIRTGTPIGGYGAFCAGPPALYWTDNTGNGLDSPEYAARFAETMAKAGYRVVGDPKRLFDVKAERLTARYLIGAQLLDLQQSLCKDSFGIYGQSFVAIEWQVFSLAEQRVVYTTRTSGTARTERGAANASSNLTRGAFSDAVANLAAERRFRQVVAVKPADVAITPAASAAIEIPRYAPFREPAGERLAQLAGATVTIFAAGSQGSGFFISDDGYILTNRHVVGEADQVNIRLAAGVELVGRVLRRHPGRDVALLKVDLGRTRALPLRQAPVQVGEPVYAIGSPLRSDLAGSVTRGIVSAVRRQTRNGLEQDLIQSDAAIQAGNSGGPLLDAAGNVVGIAVSGIGVGAFNAGVNFFIPIADALQHLNIRLGQARELRF